MYGVASLESVKYCTVIPWCHYHTRCCTVFIFIPLLTDSGCFQPDVSSRESGPGYLEIWDLGSGASDIVRPYSHISLVVPLNRYTHG